jgi:hypothetical protein
MTMDGHRLGHLALEIQTGNAKSLIYLRRVYGTRSARIAGIFYAPFNE